MKNWYCVATNPTKEFSCKRALEHDGYSVYLPKTLKDKDKSLVGAPKPIPFYPGYLFIHLEIGVDDFYRARKTPHVNNILRYGDTYTPVPNSVIEALRSMEKNEIIETKFMEYQDGEVVRFKEGHKLANYEGIIQKDPKQRVFVLLEIMGKQQRIKAKPQDIVPAE